MPTVIVPFRQENAKARLSPLPEEARAAIAEAMLADVLAAATAVGRATVVREADQGEAVELALRGVEPGPILVVNADLPCAHARDLLALLGALPDGGMALVEAPDGTTNALALAARFRARAERLDVPVVTVDIPNLADDVDTVDDLERVESRLGPHTAAALGELRAGLVP
jgi:2-phospho-L-lactate guanylyltransferase (CobY/MobA/RfbA family)